MDASHLLTFVIGSVFGILFLKLVPYCSILFMEVRQKLRTLIAFRCPTPPYEPLNTIEDPSSLESVKGEYDVFLSFHGKDTRNNFVCHLYEELNRNGIRTFIDDKRLEKGKPIAPYLLEAIEKSKISIVVFSPNYASSSWCLDELLKIVECKKTKPQHVLPVFVNVDPTNVQKRKGTFALAFLIHRISLVGRDRIQKWSDALSQISTIAGWDSRNCSDGNQAGLIQRVAVEVSNLICKKSSLETPLVGIDSYMKDIDEKLDLNGTPASRMLGIWGPGVIGKTTIARCIYEKYSSENGFEARCFLSDVKGNYKQYGGAIALQKELISKTFSQSDLNVSDKNEGCNFLRRLESKKVFIVLDDVDEREQLEDLANKEWFGPGSRIIITTRDKGLLEQHDVDVENIYEVQFLEKDKALQLFSMHAFKKNEPPMDFLELSYRFVSFTQCLPLALKFLGSSLYKKERGFWQGQLDNLGRYPADPINQSLKTSYDGLDELCRKVFLDVAFFFVGDTKAKVEDILLHFGFLPQYSLPILENRALISFDKFRNHEIILMHDLIKMMGHNIVKEESKGDPSKLSRSCNLNYLNELKDVLTKESVESSMEGMCLWTPWESISLKPNAFEKMNRLRILKFTWAANIHIPEGLNSLPMELRYFYWDGFQYKSLPFTSFGENLVELILVRSKLEYLWGGEMEFRRLKKIDLSFSTSLKAFPDLSRVRNIEEVILDGCSNCYEFPSDLRSLQKLKILDFRNCKKLDKLPMLPPSLVKLVLCGSPIIELSSGFKFLTKLEILMLISCRNLILTRSTEFPQCIGELRSLKTLNMVRIRIEELPQTIEHLHELECLDFLLCTDLVRLPSCMHRLASLQKIWLNGCRSLVSLPKLPPLLKSLSAKFCESLEFLKCNNWNCFKELGYINFVGCHKLSERSRIEIMECARVMCHSYMENQFFEHKQINYAVPRINIPKWFEYKSCKTSITVKLPSSSRQKIQGFAFCVAYTNNSSIPLPSVETDLIHLRSFPAFGNERLGDHVVVWDYHFNDAEKKVLTENLGCELQFNVSCDSCLGGHAYRTICDVFVKEWGVHMILDEEGLAK